MNRREFTLLRNEAYAAISKINDVKGHDYAGDDDALSNFKAGAKMLGVSPYVIWYVYFHKHWSAIQTFLKEGDVQSEPIDGRIHDAILYLFLLLGLIEDAKNGDPGPQPQVEHRCDRIHQKHGQCDRWLGHDGYHYSRLGTPAAAQWGAD